MHLCENVNVCKERRSHRAQHSKARHIVAICIIIELRDEIAPRKNAFCENNTKNYENNKYGKRIWKKTKMV